MARILPDPAGRHLGASARPPRCGKFKITWLFLLVERSRAMREALYDRTTVTVLHAEHVDLDWLTDRAPTHAEFETRGAIRK